MYDYDPITGFMTPDDIRKLEKVRPMNQDEYTKYIRYAVILVLAAATAGVVWLVQWLFAFSFSQDELLRIFWTLMGLLGVAVPGAMALKATKKDLPPSNQDK